MTTTPFRRLCVFCGSSPGRNDSYSKLAHDLGRTLAHNGVGVVYGGGNVGLMGVLADAALRGGGEVTGVIPEALMARELGHTGITKLHVVSTMHERKALMAELSDGFISLPGGLGTFEEFFEVITWACLGLHSKPCVLLNHEGFYDPLIALLDHAMAEGFIRPAQRERVLVEPGIGALLARMAAFHPPGTHQWIKPDNL